MQRKLAGSDSLFGQRGGRIRLRAHVVMDAERGCRAVADAAGGGGVFGGWSGWENAATGGGDTGTVAAALCFDCRPAVSLEGRGNRDDEKTTENEGNTLRIKKTNKKGTELKKK